MTDGTIGSRPYVVALEEHYWAPEMASTLGGQAGGLGEQQRRLLDLGDLRLKEMDSAGIDMQVISHVPRPMQTANPEAAVVQAAKANNHLHEATQAHSNRFAGFATLPLADPAAAADELERAVTQLGFKGALVAPLTHGVFLDDPRFWPVFERAAALDVPMYVHPGQTHPAVVEAYYKDYVKKFPAIVSAGWGWTVETATQAVRLVLSGIFEAYPNLKIIVGHMGESVPFSLHRIDEVLNRHGENSISFRDVFCEHFWITTSGNFSTPALLCSMLELGVDHILFSVDWPFVENQPGMDWMETVPLSAEDKAKIYGSNAKRLLKL